MFFVAIAFLFACEENFIDSIDFDGDGISNWDEIHIYMTDPLLLDTDDDGLNDDKEILNFFTSAIDPDTDGDGLTDYEEIFNNSDPLDFCEPEPNFNPERCLQ